jgi:RNA polymerase sigma-70 factor (ECF subfamily)
MDDEKPSDELQHMTTTHQVLARGLPFADLLAGARVGNNAHIGELQRRYGAALLSAIKHTAGERAQEVVDDTFMSLPKKLRGYVDDGRFDKWLFVVAYNIARSSNRSSRRHREEFFPEPPVDAGRDASAIARADEKEILAEAMRVLPDSEREAWLLHFQGYEPSEIGEMLGISANSASVRIHRAKKKLREIMGGE